MSTPDLPQLSHLARQRLVESARSLGIKLQASPCGSTLEAVGLGWRLHARVPQVSSTGQRCAVQLVLESQGDAPGSSGIDSCAGTGATWNEAVASAVDGWVDGALPVWIEALQALSGAPVEPRFRLKIPLVLLGAPSEWAVFEGGLQLSADPADAAVLVEAVEEFPLIARLSEAGALPRLDTAQMHVVKAVLTRSGERTQHVEVRFDGETQVRAEDVLRATDLPACPGGALLRQYAVLVPVSPLPRGASPVDAHTH